MKNCYEILQKLNWLQELWKLQYRIGSIAKTQLPWFQKGPQNEARNIKQDGLARNDTNLQTRVPHKWYCKNESNLYKKNIETAKTTSKN